MLADAAGTSLAEFAANIRRDLAAVQAALDLPWTTTPAEGQINRLKMLKQTMYGRAGFPLLRARVLHAARPRNDSTAIVGDPAFTGRLEARSASANGSRSRLLCWFTHQSAGNRFQRSPQGHVDQARQWSTSRRSAVSRLPLHTQWTAWPSSSRFSARARQGDIAIRVRPGHRRGDGAGFEPPSLGRRVALHEPGPLANQRRLDPGGEALQGRPKVPRHPHCAKGSQCGLVQD